MIIPINLVRWPIDNVLKSMYKNPDKLFMKVTAREMLFDGLITDCSDVPPDSAGELGCKELERTYEKYHVQLVGEKKYASSFFGWVSY